MVEQIYDVNVLKGLIEQDVPAVCMMLDNDSIEMWKKEGKFKFLNEQLRDIPNLKFACVKQSDGSCIYHFIPKTVELKERICNMLMSLLGNEYIALTKCSNKHVWRGKAGYSVDGEAAVCQLF